MKGTFSRTVLAICLEEQIMLNLLYFDLNGCVVTPFYQRVVSFFDFSKDFRCDSGLNSGEHSNCNNGPFVERPPNCPG